MLAVFQLRQIASDLRCFFGGLREVECSPKPALPTIYFYVEEWVSVVNRASIDVEVTSTWMDTIGLQVTDTPNTTVSMDGTTSALLLYCLAAVDRQPAE